MARFDDDFWDSVEYDPNFGWDDARNLLFDEYNQFLPGTEDYQVALQLWEHDEYELFVSWEGVDPQEFWEDFRDAYDAVH